MLKGKLKFIIAIAVIALTVSYLVYGGVKDTMVYYLTVEELKAQVPTVYDSRVRVSGMVVPGTIMKDTNGALEFQITDGTQTIDVAYEGIVPDIFADDVEAVVEGVYAKNDVFEADTLLAKCPTKYESTDSLYENKETSY
ncbi:MAG: cytochrome c-type biogenesis protein CcmE [Thermodesulfobacteriota bacterium]|nr:MAG: cytochrome c-type biogenesis protein CcmE [Thermodesulfobacteriota bacterium]